MDTSLKGKIVAITGASAGIGEACANAFAERGADVIVLARRFERVEALAKRLEEEHGVRAIAGRLDVRDADAVNQYFSTLDDSWSKIDVLVNNAGLARGLNPIHEGSTTDWDEMIDTNVKGILHVSRAVLSGMLERKSGHVINVGSLAGAEVYPGGNVYCASKHAVRAITESMRQDYYDTPLRFTLIAPATVENEFSIVRFHGDEEKAKTVYRGFTPLSSADVAEAVVFAATRPAHVNVSGITLMPTAQGSSTRVHRES